MKKEKDIIFDSYKNLFNEIKEKVKTSQMKAAISVNKELIQLYWEIGISVFEKQKKEGWGAKTIEKLAKDLKSSFPDMRGLSFRNLKYMVMFSKEYPDFLIGQQAVAQIPWGHNILLLQKVKSTEEKLWYAKQVIEHGWSRSVLWHWIDSCLYKRHGKSVNNFRHTLPPLQSDLVEQTLRDPYNFEFLTLRSKYEEKELENGLIDHIQKFLVELGSGFAFVGRQYHLEVEKTDYYLDLLFYHLKLRCYCVIELKAKEFDPRDVGQVNFYLSAVDDILRHPDDNPTIGIILCKTKNKVKAEYALRNLSSPIGVSKYELKILESLPKKLKGSLPTIEEIEQELGGD